MSYLFALNSTMNSLLFISFFKINILEMIVIILLLLLIKVIIKNIKMSKLIKQTIESNYTLYNFTKDTKDENSKRRLIAAVINDIKRTHPNIKLKRAKLIIELEIKALFQPIYIRLFFYLLKLLRIILILVLIGLIIIFISIIYDNTKENAIEMPSTIKLVDDIKDGLGIENLNTNDKIIENDNGNEVVKNSSSTNVLSKTEYTADVTQKIEIATNFYEKQNYDAAIEILAPLIDGRLEDYPKLASSVYELSRKIDNILSEQRIPWGEGVQEAFENRMIELEYADSKETIRYEDQGGEGYYSVFAELDGIEMYIVTVNVYTGWFHG